MNRDDLNAQFPKGFTLTHKPSDAPTKRCANLLPSYTSERIAEFKLMNDALDATYRALEVPSTRDIRAISDSRKHTMQVRELLELTVVREEEYASHSEKDGW